MNQAALHAWRMLLLAQWREQPGRMLVTLLAITLGVSLGAAVYLVNSAALREFGLATKHLVGEADIVVRGPREGFDEQLFARLARDPQVSLASPILELDAVVNARRETLKIVGLDPFRAVALQPALLGEIGAHVLEMLRTGGLFLSASAARDLGLADGGSLQVTVGGERSELKIIGVLSDTAYPQPLGIMDIAAAQWKLGKLGVVNRIDLQVKSGSDPEALRAAIGTRLPPGVVAVAPQVELERAASATRAYRVNLNMLALVALFTGAFLVFSTQSLAVLRRRQSLALLRALGLTRLELRTALLGEGVALGVVGSILGVLLGIMVASIVLKYLAADLGNGQLRASGASVAGAPLSLLAFVGIGTLTAALGAWLPAGHAARLHPAQALKGSHNSTAPLGKLGWRTGVGLLLAGALLALLPAVRSLPVFGYLAVGMLLFGAVLLVPALTVIALRLAPTFRGTVFNTARAQLRENVGLAALSLASIIVSFSLMVAMATMVYSFRESFEVWLDKLLPADLQLREPFDNDTAYLSPADQARLAGIRGVVRTEFRRTRRLLLDPARAAVTLIVRGTRSADTASELPLTQHLDPLPDDPAAPPVWISEAMLDLYGFRVGDVIELPLQGTHRYTVAGVWRDYARSQGSVVMARETYLAAGGDEDATEASVWIEPSADPARLEAALRAALPAGEAIEFISSSALHERSVQIFDRAFAITYALEAIAVLIGLMGVSFAASSAALSRRAEFGMLRHIGMLRRQVLALVATEGILTSAFGVLYGLGLGLALSLILVYVVNRQSFHWSIDLKIPGWALAILSLALLAAAALTALVSGRAALSQDAVRAVREDW